MNQGASNWRRAVSWKWVLTGFLAVVAFFLWSEHHAHLAGALPYLLVAACPLMHLFHHGHGHGRSHRRDDAAPPPGRGSGQPPVAGDSS